MLLSKYNLLTSICRHNMVIQNDFIQFDNLLWEITLLRVNNKHNPNRLMINREIDPQLYVYRVAIK